MERIISENPESVKLFDEAAHCYHCGDTCPENIIKQNNRYFCCDGCRLVYEILEENNLSNYYKLNKSPGNKDTSARLEGKFDFLNNKQIVDKLITFTDGKITQISFMIPAIHCSSCIWLLENLYKIHSGIISSLVNFLKREVRITFKNEEINLKELVSVLHAIGYPPHLSLQSVNSKPYKTDNKKTYYKLGVAFFAFGNIMLMSFPEYFGIRLSSNSEFLNLFGYINIVLSIPVLLYSASDFFKSSYIGIRQKHLNMDIPLTLGITAMYLRSLYEILSDTGAGYMDTFTALVFFMLAGRLFQNKTYQRLSFERDYKSYFPIAVTAINDGKSTTKPVNELKYGDRIVIRNEELLPVDSVLKSGVASIDYSFVTGESTPVSKNPGDTIYAGGKQIGSAIELDVINEISKSRLTQLWNEENYISDTGKAHTSIVDRVSKYFTVVILLIALTSFVYYLTKDETGLAFISFTSVLIITCPCALALSYPFAMGNSIRIFGQNGFYLKNTFVIERMSKITDIIFDKTGTLTQVGDSEIHYYGHHISKENKIALFTLFSQSNHPISRVLVNYLKGSGSLVVDEFLEQAGFGLSGKINHNKYIAGSASLVDVPSDITHNNLNRTIVHWSYNGQYMGHFEISNKYRPGINVMFRNLITKFRLHVLSGDNDSEKLNLNTLFNGKAKLLFNQSPNNKLNYVKQLQKNQATVMMVGDGLNDAGALRQSDCGIAVSDDINNFSPACDGILGSSSMTGLSKFILFSKTTMVVIFTSYLISLIYNTIGIWYAVQGMLSPLVAAVIMPLSTVTIIAFTTLATGFASRLIKLNH